MEDLLRFIRTYGHDFLNHLQVISGYVQLHKIERIREYIGQVSAEIHGVSRITRLSVPEIGAGLLALRECAARYGVPLYIDVENDFHPTPAASDLRRALVSLGELFAAVEGLTAPASLTVAAGGESAVGLALPVAPASLGAVLDRFVDEANRHLAPARGEVVVRETEDGTTILLRVPAPSKT